MQEFIDSYKEAFGIDKEVKLKSSLSEGEIEVTEKGYLINTTKDADTLVLLGKIKLHTLLNDTRVFTPKTDFMEIIVLAHIYGTLAKHLEVLEVDLLVEKLLIAKKDAPYESYAVLKILEADPTLTGGDSSLIDHYLTLEFNSELLNEIETMKNENE